MQVNYVFGFTLIWSRYVLKTVCGWEEGEARHENFNCSHTAKSVQEYGHHFNPLTSPSSVRTVTVMLVLGLDPNTNIRV